MAVHKHTRATVVLAAGVVVLLVPAVVAETAALGGSVAAQPSLVALVAGAFAASGLALTSTKVSPWVPPLLAGTGIAWLLPSLVPGTLLWHQGVLLVALTVPVRGPRWTYALLIALAAGLAFGVGGQLLGAAAFAAAALAGLWPPARGLHQVQVVASGLMAMTLCGLAAWQTYGDYVPSAGLLTYEVALLAVAVVVGAGGRLLDSRAARMQGRLLARPPGDGIEGLVAILRDELKDPSLRLMPPGSAGVPVVEDGRTVAVLAGREGTLADGAVAAAATESVRVVRLWVERREQAARRQASLVEARRRVSRAVQEEQGAMATELANHVMARIREAVAGLDDLDVGGAAAGAVAEARAQLGAADAAVAEAVTGTARAQADGIVGELALLAARSAVPCTCRVDLPDDRDVSAGLSPDGVRCLSFVCSEALANVHKHANASRVEVVLRYRAGSVELTILDDGTGGADPAGSGLRGLADRLRSLGGTLTVGPADEGGTEVVARVPVAQPVEAIRVHGRSTR